MSTSQGTGPLPSDGGTMDQAAAPDLATPRAGPRRTLPPEALVGLRVAFAAELAERLPRLADAGPGSDGSALVQARRDAHNLASSCIVVGEHVAAQRARDLERAIDSGDVDAVPRLTAELVALLGQWAA